MYVVMNGIKKIICLLLCTVILAWGTVMPADAKTASVPGVIYPYVPQVEEYYPGIEEYIAECIRQRQTKIDIRKFAVAKDDIIYIYKSTVFDNPDIFYVNASYVDYVFDKASNIIFYLKPSYIYSLDSIPEHIKKFNNGVNTLLKGIDSSWSDYTKALVLHDRLAVFCKYKYENASSYTAYSAVVTGKSICEGYSRAYCYLLSRVGVDSKCINSESLSHCWNMVKIGSYWYHVDVTKDDPTPDTPGYVRHTYCLSSDSKLKSDSSSDKHTGWKSDVTYSSQYSCTDKTYDNYYFKKMTSQFVYRDGSYYYINNNYKGKHYSALIKRTGGKNKAIKVIKDVWYTSGNKLYKDSFSRLCQTGGYIYFNSKRNFYRLKLSTGKCKKVFEAPDFWSKDFYGIREKGSYIYGGMKKKNSDNASVKKILKITDGKVLQLPFIKNTSVTIKKKNTYTMKVYRGSGKTSYKSSNPKVAKVNKKGAIKALKKGSCRVTAVKNGVEMTCFVKVKK